jgi:hypothetical protein
MLSVNKDFQVRLAITRKGVSCRFQRERRGKQETRSQTRRCREAKGPSVLEPVRVIIIDLNLTRTPSSTGQGKEGADCRRRTLSTTAGVFPTRLDAESEAISETEITSVKARRWTRKTGESILYHPHCFYGGPHRTFRRGFTRQMGQIRRIGLCNTKLTALITSWERVHRGTPYTLPECTSFRN